MILYHISAKKLITRCTFSMLAASLILCPAVFSGCSAKTENVKNTDAGSQDPISATAIKLILQLRSLSMILRTESCLQNA